ncbi:MAG: serine/threonine-protein kinase [Planctomycetota bacterium]
MSPSDAHLNPADRDTSGESGSAGRVQRDLIVGALDQADRMVMSSVAASSEDVSPEGQTSIDGPPAHGSVGGGTVSGGTGGMRPGMRPGVAQAVARAAATSRSRAVDLPPGFFPGYDVVREVHRGGQGVVFEAVERATNDKVAIKLLHGGATSEGSAIARFEREVEVLQGLDYDGIVAVHGSGRTADGGFYYVMDYIAGEPLDVIVRRLRTGVAEAEPWDQTRSKFTLFARSMTGLRSKARRRDRGTRQGQSRRAELGPAADPESQFISPSTLEGDSAGPDDATRAGAGSASRSASVTTRHRRRSTQRSAVVSSADPELRKLLELFAQICDSVAAAHMRGVIHRDLKPANIRLDTRGNPILVDFGLAKIDPKAPEMAEQGMMTQTGQFVGSMPWASPEQAAGEHASVDVRSDVYSLGVILYQLLTGGRFPYKVIGSVREVLDEILYTEPARPSEWGRRVSDELETIVLKALSKPRERRYQSAGELGQDIRRYLAGEPIAAKRDSTFYVLSKTIQRHKTQTGIAATAAAALVIFSFAMGPLYLRANAAENRASRNFGLAMQSDDTLRDLVHTMLYDFHGEVRHLSGGTAARELLLENAEQYLDVLVGKLKVMELDDRLRWGLMADVANANDQLGELYGGQYVANTGRTELAGDHFRESRRIREALLAADPENSAVHLGLGRNARLMARWHQRTGDFDAAIESAIDSGRWYEQAGELEPASKRARTGVVMARTTEGDQHRRLIASGASLDDSRASMDRAIDLYREVQDRVVLLIADGVEIEDDPMQSPVRYAASSRLYEGLALLALANEIHEFTDGALQAEDADPELIATKRAEMETLRSSALPVLEDASERMLTLAEARPEIRDFQRDVVMGHYAVGLAYERIGRAAEDGRRESALDTAQGNFEIALELAEDLARDGADLEAQRDYSLVLNRLTAVAILSEKYDLAEAVGREMLELREDVAAKDPSVRHERDLAVAHYRLGDLAEKRSENVGLDGPDSGDFLREAAHHYRVSLALFADLAAQGVQAESEIAQLETLIGKIEGQLGEAR